MKALASLLVSRPRTDDAPLPAHDEELHGAPADLANASSGEPAILSNVAADILQKHFDALDDSNAVGSLPSATFTSSPDESALTLREILYAQASLENDLTTRTFAETLPKQAPAAYRKNPELLFPHLEKLFAHPESAASARFWTRSEWRSIMVTLSLSSNRLVAKSRIITALQWKIQCGVLLTVADALMLATFTVDDRRTTEDAETFLADIKKHFNLDPTPKLHVQLIHGLAHMTSGEEAGRFVQKCLTHADEKRIWTPDHFRAVYEGLGEAYDFLYRRYENPPNRSAVARLERAESNTEKMLRIFMILFKDSYGDLANADIYNGVARIVRHSVKSLDDARLFLRRMKVEGFEPNTETYSLLAGHLIDNGAHGDATELLKSMRAEGLAPDIRSTSATISALAAEGRTAEGWEVWAALSETDKSTILGDKRFCDIFLSTLLRRTKGHDRALAFAQAMCARGTVPSPSANRSIIFRLLNKQAVLINTAVDYFHRVRAAIKLHRDQLATLGNKDHPLGHRVHNRMIAELASSGEIRAALQIYSGMEALGLVPDAVTITPLIQHCTRLRMHDATRALLADLARFNIAPDVILYTTLVRNLAESKQFSAAAKLLKQMEEAGMPPNEHTYNVLIGGLVRAGHLKLAKQIRDGMQLPDILRSKTIASNIILGGMIKGNHGKEVVLSMWKDMEKANFIDRASLNIMIPFLFRQGDIEAANRLSRVITGEASSSNTVQTSNIFIQHYLKLGRVQDALDVFKSLNRPDVYSFMWLVSHYSASGDLPAAERLIKQYLITVPRQELDARIASVFFEKAGKLPSNDGVPIVDRTLEALRKAGARPNPYTYAAALGVYHLNGASSQASALVADISSQPDIIRMHSAIMNAIIDGYAKSGDIAGMERVAVGFAEGLWPISDGKAASQFQCDILGAWASSTSTSRNGAPRLEPNIATLNVMMGGYGYARRLDDVLRLYRYLRSHHLPVYSKSLTDPEEYDENSRHVCWRIAYSLLFDALGFARDRKGLEHYWREVQETTQTPLDTNNWTSYLEAKMRCGCVSETLAILNSPPAEFQPDIKTLHNILYLAKAAADEHIVRGPPHGEPPLPAKATLQSLADVIAGRVWAVIRANYPEHEEAIRHDAHTLLARVKEAEERAAVATAKSAFTNLTPGSTQKRLVFAKSATTGQRAAVSRLNRAVPGKSPKPDANGRYGPPVVVRGPMSALVSHYDRAANNGVEVQAAYEAERERQRRSRST
ncbi:hypothetical protein HDU86_002271 [Geranomyces michiganensis]|nr:hypothetical protein HDU86_002271 [Geranomyces michiganensis]